ncbi:hypothetical protein ALC56_05991, partial [Trachymyrmex septentrionalis]
VPTRGRPSGRLAGLQGRQSAEESAYDTHRHAFTLVRSQTCLNSFSLSPFPTLLPGLFPLPNSLSPCPPPLLGPPRVIQPACPPACSFATTTTTTTIAITTTTSQPPAPAAPPSSSAHTTTFLSLLIHLPGPSFSEVPTSTPLTHRHRDLLNPLARTRRLVVGCTASRTFRLTPLLRPHFSSFSSPSSLPLSLSLRPSSHSPRNHSLSLFPSFSLARGPASRGERTY